MRRFVPTRLKKPARPADFYITDRQILIEDKSNRPFVGGGLLAELAVIAVQNATKTTLFNAPVQNISRIGYPIKDRYAISAGTYSPETYMLFSA